MEPTSFSSSQKQDIVSEAKKVLKIEAQAIENLNNYLEDNFLRAVELVFKCTGKVIITGMGKSGQIARKISSTLSSTGTPSVFVHPSESSHGDLGVISNGDIVIAISYGGESSELNDIISFVARKGNPLIGISGNPQSTLAKSSDVFVNVRVELEACPMGLAPTASTTATLAMGDALAMAVLKLRGFREADFAQLHPGGKLGRKLLTRVKDLMRSGEELPLVKKETHLRDILLTLARGEVRGVAGVVNDSGQLIGCITDGDIRRRVAASPNFISDRAQDLMSNKPKTIALDELAEKALLEMERHKIQSLFVLDSAEKNNLVGVIYIQDLLRAKIR